MFHITFKQTDYTIKMTRNNLMKKIQEKVPGIDDDSYQKIYDFVCDIFDDKHNSIVDIRKYI
jgi:hypothetical protein